MSTRIAGGSALDNREGLPTGMLLDGSYRIMRMVGSGGFGITYEAEDISLGTVVAIKEYYPFDFGERSGTMSVRPKSDRHKRTFDWGRSNFLEEARILARFEHPSIVRVARVFEANSTAYMVMRFERGKSFEDWLKGLGRLPTQEELDRIVATLLDALQTLHASDFLHRDLAPDNIIVRADGTPVLLDFGAARRSVAEVSQSLTDVVKVGYSPHEQYSSEGRLQGPWSDIYALGGTLYRAIAGKAPEEATSRFDEDRMPPAADIGRGHFRPGFLAGIDTCLKVRPSQRPQSVAELRPLLFEREEGRDLKRSKAQSKRRLQPSEKAKSTDSPSTTRRWSIILAGIVAILGGAYGGHMYTRLKPTDLGNIDAEKRRRQTEEAIKQQSQLAAEKQRKEREEADRRQAVLDAEKQRKDAEEAVKRQAALDAEKQRKAEIEEERARRSHEVFKDCDTCPDLVRVAAGEYLMGSSKADIDSGAAAGNEGPQRKIVMRQVLAVGRFEVTRDQFEAFVQASGHDAGSKCWTLEGNEPKEREPRSFRNPGYVQVGTHPAVCVSWEDAKAYVNWLSKTTGKAYDLLSEAQWEYVARAGTTARHAFGNAEADLCAFGNGADRTASTALPAKWDYLRCDDAYVHTAPVGSFKPNAFGISDMMGNVWEWTADCYAESLAGTPADRRALTSGDCRVRTVRGGSWSATAHMLRVAVRGKAPASSRFDDVGFRVLRTLSVEP
jgi:formylglycine-generating enzyme required for sulfatase activity/serine/threonine protein kinase